MTMNKLEKLLLFTVCVFFVGCAFGSKMKYHDTTIDFASTKSPVGLTVWDQRPYVLTGNKSPQFIGLQRSAYGIPFGVHTESGVPLVIEFRQAIQKRFENNSVSVVANDIPFATSKSYVISSLAKTKAPVCILITVVEWKSDTLSNVAFTYDLIAEAYDTSSNLLAQKRLTGKKSLDASFWNPIGSSERLMVEQQRLIFGELLSSPEISAILN